MELYLYSMCLQDYLYPFLDSTGICYIEDFHIYDTSAHLSSAFLMSVMDLTCVLCIISV